MCIDLSISQSHYSYKPASPIIHTRGTQVYFNILKPPGPGLLLLGPWKDVRTQEDLTFAPMGSPQHVVEGGEG